MTSIEAKEVRRTVTVRDRGYGDRLYVARFTREGVYLRAKGKRTEYGPVSWSHILIHAAKINAQAIREAKDLDRAARRAARAGR
jgi:hypothetical protein